MTAPFEYTEATGLALAVGFGFLFGISLERGGLGNPHKLTGVFYLRDFAVPKAMFTAILVAAVGLYALSGLGLVDLARVWVIPAFFWPQLIGGALFGIGYFVSGYCPGTAMTAFASGRIDALVAMAGIIVGSLLFAAVFPWIEGFYLSSDMGAATLQRLLGVNPWFIIAVLIVLAGGMFALMERRERGGSRV